MSQAPRAEFERALQRLADPATRPDARLVRMLSAPMPADRALWLQVWPAIDADRRRWIARCMLETAESSFEADFVELCVLLLADVDARVRALAVDGLWECERPRLVEPLAALMRSDPDADVRARAAAALGAFVLLGELGRLDADRLEQLVLALTDVAGDESEEVEVRRRATESVGYADHAVASAAIHSALESHELPLRAGALRAMGRSACADWEEEVILALESEEAELRFEAARAAGELALASAVPLLLALAETDDREIQMEAIWAMGEIGGRAASRALERVSARADDEDDDLREALEEALAMAVLGAELS